MELTMRLLKSVLLSFAFLFVTFSANALDGIPKAMIVGGKTLTLNGAGTRTKFIISVYNMGLFLGKKSNNAGQIMAANEPMGIRMKIVSGFASNEKIKNALNEGFKKSTGGKTAPIQPQINQLLTAGFTDKVTKGDVFDLVYTPQAGTQVIKNGKNLTVVKGLPLKKALFGIWLSNNPVQGNLKSALLGN